MTESDRQQGHGKTGGSAQLAAVADARFLALAHAIDDAVVVVDGVNVVRFANPAADRMFGHGNGLLGQPFLIPLQSATPGLQSLETAPGRWMKLDLSVTATVWNEAVGWLGVFRAQPVLAADTGRALDEAMTAMRGRFLAHVSHELRTPLNSVIGFSELMALELHGPLGATAESADRYRAYAQDIASSGSRLANLMSDLLDLARAEAGQLRIDESRFDLGGLIAEVAADAEAARLGTIEPVVLDGDRDKLKRALQHLVANGVTHRGEGGTVTISAVTSRDGHVLIGVSDSGDGFSQAALARAFEPFGRARDVARADPRAGPGVGLALVRHMFELHGGTVRIESRSGEGASVTCLLPRDRIVPVAHEDDSRRH